MRPLLRWWLVWCLWAVLVHRHTLRSSGRAWRWARAYDSSGAVLAGKCSMRAQPAASTLDLRVYWQYSNNDGTTWAAVKDDNVNADITLGAEGLSVLTVSTSNRALFRALVSPRVLPSGQGLQEFSTPFWIDSGDGDCRMAVKGDYFREGVTAGPARGSDGVPLPGRCSARAQAVAGHHVRWEWSYEDGWAPLPDAGIDAQITQGGAGRTVLTAPPERPVWFRAVILPELGGEPVDYSTPFHFGVADCGLRIFDATPVRAGTRQVYDADVTGWCEVFFTQPHYEGRWQYSRNGGISWRDVVFDDINVKRSSEDSTNLIEVKRSDALFRAALISPGEPDENERVAGYTTATLGTCDSPAIASHPVTAAAYRTDADGNRVRQDGWCEITARVKSGLGMRWEFTTDDETWHPVTDDGLNARFGDSGQLLVSQTSADFRAVATYPGTGIGVGYSSAAGGRC